MDRRGSGPRWKFTNHDHQSEGRRDQLTGSVSGRRGDNPISDGKISGDDISFNVVLEFQGNSIKMIYTGKVSGDEIKFKREVEGRGSTEFTAKRSPAT